MIITKTPVELLISHQYDLTLFCDSSTRYTSSITKSSNNISQWGDLSGNKRNATQATLSQQPIYNETAINNRPALTFNGSSSFMTCARSVQDDWTIVLVCYPLSAGAGNTHWYQGRGIFDAEVPGVVNDYGMAFGSTTNFMAGVGNPDTTITSGNFPLDNAYTVFFTRIANSGLMELHVNGTKVDTLTGPTGTKSSSAINNIGIMGTITSRIFNGHIGYIATYNEKMSDAMIAYYNQDLVNKWGI